MDLQLATKKSDKVFTYDLIGTNYMMVYMLGKINVTTKEPVEVAPGLFGHKVVSTTDAPPMNYEEFKAYAKKTLLVNIDIHGGVACFCD